MNKNTTCILPWISVDRNVDSSDPVFSPCCLYQAQDNKPTNFSEYWDGKELQNVRQQMTEGKRPPGCWKCWNDEDSGKKSMRQSVNESRLRKHQDLINKHDVKPIQVKLLSGASCNLACRMCQSHVSSKVHKVWEDLGLPLQEPYRYDDESERIIRENADTVRYIDLMGGEPFYNKKVHNLIEWLANEGHAEHITVYVTTNAMLLNEKLISDLEKFEKVVVIVSLDAVGSKHEYIRPGASWQTIVSNIEKLQKCKFDVVIQPVISAINILCLPELERWCEARKLHMTQMSLVHSPEALHPKNLPSALKLKVDPKYSAFINEPMTDSSIDFIKKLDTYWDTKIYDSMPEWLDVYEGNHGDDTTEKDYGIYRKTLEQLKEIE